MIELPTVASYFWRNVESHPDAVAFLAAELSSDHRPVSQENTATTDFRERTWLELGDCVAEVCHWFANIGLSSGEHVATCLPNGLPWIAIDLACQSLGLVHVAIDARETPARVLQRIHSSDSVVSIGPLIAPAGLAAGGSKAVELVGAKLGYCNFATAFRSNTNQRIDDGDSSNLSSNAARLDWCAERARRQRPAQPAMVLFTSGTLGQPKGVLLSHENLVSNAAAKLNAAPQYADDLRLNVLPFAHAYARTCELSTWVLTASRLMVSENWQDLLRLAPLVQPTLVNLVPQLALRLQRTLRQRPNALGTSLRLLQVGGAALPDWLWHALADAGWPPLQGYGLTEAGPVVCSNRSGQQAPGIVGSAVQGVEMKLTATRELLIRSPGVMLGYYRDAVATQATIDDGWLHTGDLAELTEAGTVKIIGRSSAQIVLSTGYNVSPECVEARLLMDDVWEQVVVVGHNQPALGLLLVLSPQGQERIAAESANARAEPSASRLATWCLQRCQAALSDLPSQFLPRHVCILPHLLTVDAGTCTTKGTPVRSRVLELYAQEIQAMFSR